MNDRFKFRVYVNENEEYPEKIGYIDTEDFYVYPDGDIGFFNADYDYAEYVIEQCTGLKDKNGKLIYEGDILLVEALDWKKKEGWEAERVKTYWSVEYKSYWNQCGFMVFGKNRRFHKPLTRTVIFNSEAIIIGNIHDNPELLKEEQ